MSVNTALEEGRFMADQIPQRTPRCTITIGNITVIKGNIVTFVTYGKRATLRPRVKADDIWVLVAAARWKLGGQTTLSWPPTCAPFCAAQAG